MNSLKLMLLMVVGIQMPVSAMPWDTILSFFASKPGLALSTFGVGVGVTIWGSSGQDLNNCIMDKTTLEQLTVVMYDPDEDLQKTSNYLDRFVAAAKEQNGNLFKNMPYAPGNDLTIQSALPDHISQQYNEDLKKRLEENKLKQEPLKVDQILYILHSRIYDLNKKSCERSIKAIAHHAFSSSRFPCPHEEEAKISDLEESIHNGKTVGEQIHDVKKSITFVGEEIKGKYIDAFSRNNKGIGITLASLGCLTLGIYGLLK